MYINITNEFEVQRKCSESSCSDSEIIAKNVDNDLEETHKQQEQQENCRQSQQQISKSSTYCNNVETNAQLNNNNDLQL